MTRINEPNYIELTAAQAKLVGGKTANGSFLDPTLLCDGQTWVLPLAVLDDPDHAEHHALLVSLPVREVHPEDVMPDPGE